MSEAQPPEPSDPFSGIPMFGDLAKALAGQGPISWDAARQFAQLGSTGGTSEANVDPAVRVQYESLANIARLHVADVIGIGHDLAEVRTVTRGQWAGETLEAYRHLFTEMARSLGNSPSSFALEQGDDAGADDAQMMAMMAGLAKMMAPAMIGMAVGSMVGHLATTAFGTNDLPIPRATGDIAPELTITAVPANIDGFAADWEIPGDEMRLWVLAHEVAGSTLFQARHLRDALADLVRQHAGAFRPDPNAIADRLAAAEADDGGDPLAAMQRTFNDPAILLGAVQSPEQLALQPRLDALVAVVVGYTDWIVDAVAVRLVGGNALRIAEAVRRQRAETSGGQSFVEQLLGIRIGPDQVARGKAFAQGVIDRAGDHGLLPLLERDDALPTPAELDAPGLWLARLEG